MKSSSLEHAVKIHMKNWVEFRDMPCVMVEEGLGYANGVMKSILRPPVLINDHRESYNCTTLSFSKFEVRTENQNSVRGY